MTIKSADVLALLEDGPHPEAELVAWLGQSADVVRFVLKGMKRDGLLKRSGDDRKWALASYTAPIGRPKSPSGVRASLVTEQDIVAILKTEGSQTINPLARLLHIHTWTLRDQLAWWTTTDSPIRLTRMGKKGTLVELADGPHPPSPIPPRTAAPDVHVHGVRPTRIIDGVEFEIVNDCSGPVRPWPENVGSGSSLLREQGALR